MRFPASQPSHPNAIAVITGAGSGIGACFAKAVFDLGYRVILVDRSRENLERTREDLIACRDGKNGDRIELHVADLTDRDAVVELAELLKRTEPIELLINNAGFGCLVDFTEVDVEYHSNMVAVHVDTPMRLVHAVLPQMKSRRRGGIINVASLGAFAPCSQAVQYAATKAYLVVFSEALNEELRGTGVCVQALCPGFVRTPFHSTQTMKSFHDRNIPAQLWSTPEAVVACSLRALGSEKVVIIPGWQSRALGLFMRMILLKPIIRIATRPPVKRGSVVVGSTASVVIPKNVEAPGALSIHSDFEPKDATVIRDADQRTASLEG